MASEIEEQYKRMVSLPNVVGFMVINLDGIAIKSTLENAETLKYASQIAPLIERSRNMIRGLVFDEKENSEDDVTLIRLRTKQHEILISPDKDYAMVVLQRPHDRLEDEEIEGTSEYSVKKEPVDGSGDGADKVEDND